MDLKKSADANVDKLRLPFIAIGFLFIGSLTLASFSYTAGVLKNDTGKKDKDAANVKYEQEVEKPKDEPLPTPPQVQAPPPIQEEIKIEENKEEVPISDVKVDPIEIPIGKEDKKEEIEEEIIEFPDVDATFPGGPAEMMKWIQANMVYPQMAIANDDQGKVYVKFVVGSDGSISNVEVERGVTEELDREAKRVIREMPNWLPGEAKGKKARTRCRIPIVFTLE